MITPQQFPHVRVVRDELTPWDIIGMWFATQQGMRGYVHDRLDSLVYRCTVVGVDGEEDRLLGINWLKGCRFFATREEAFAPGLEAFERGAVMAGDGVR